MKQIRDSLNQKSTIVYERKPFRTNKLDYYKK